MAEEELNDSVHTLALVVGIVAIGAAIALGIQTVQLTAIRYSVSRIEQTVESIREGQQPCR